MKVKFSAVIPVVDFGNVQPEIELEGDDYKKLEEEGMGYIREAWNKYSKSPFPNNVVGNFKKFDTFTGEQILYDDSQHLYTDLKGNKLISGSEFAKSKVKPFDLELLSGKVAMKYEVPQEIVKKMWSMSGDISATFGTSLHLAMEQWFLHRNYGTEKEYHLPKPEYLKKAVISFPLKDEHVIPEVMVSDVESGMCGQIDGLVTDPPLMPALQRVYGEKPTMQIIDYKSDSDVKKNLQKHTIQMNFYRQILENKGFTISGMSVWNYINEEWTEYKLETIEI